MGEAKPQPEVHLALGAAAGLESGEVPSGASGIDDSALGPEDELLRELARLEVAEPPLSVGQRVAQFRVLSELGRGGMGVVYLAEDGRLRRRVALKVLASSAAADPERRRRLLREARSAAAVTHPAIASIYEVGESDGRVYIAMERVEGQSLRQALAHGAMAPERAVEIAVQVLRGLSAAHAGGVIHRDLKPDNIMIGDHGVVKILDFGLAKRATASASEAPAQGAETTTLITGDGHLLGTPAYMSPEQALGDPVDARSDIFSFGVVLYEMLAGQRPFAGKSSGAILGALLTKVPPPLVGANPCITEALAKVVMRCLEKEPVHRYQSCAALADDLLAASRVVPAAAPSPPADATASAPPSARSPGAAASAEALSSGAFRVDPAPGASSASARRPLGRGTVAAVGMALVAVATAAIWWSRGRAPSDKPRPDTSGAPLVLVPPSDPAWVVACPPLGVARGDEKSAWLGAVASAVFCERARVLLGGRPERTLVPAELLDLPAVPTDGFPADPYGAPGARDKALAAAKQRAHAYVDGVVRDAGAQLEVELVLRSSDGRELGSGRGTSPALYAAIREAMKTIEEGPLRARPLDADIARWSSTDDPVSALAAADLHLALYQNAGTFDQECKAFQGSFRGAGALRAAWKSFCGYVRGRSAPVVAPTPRAKDAPAFALEAWLRHMNGGVPEAHAVALELQGMVRGESSAWGRASLSSVEACLWQSIDPERAHAAALGSVAAAPENDSPFYCENWVTLVLTAPRGASRTNALNAAEAWRPMVIALGLWTLESTIDAERSATEAARAYRLAPESADIAQHHFIALLDAGEREAARAVALRLRNRDDVPVLALQADILLARIDVEDGRFAAALGRATKAMSGPHQGYARFQTAALAWQAVQVADVLGRRETLAERIVRDLVLAEPPGLDPLDSDHARMAALCASSPARVAVRCLERLRLLRKSAYLVNPVGEAEPVIEAAERCARGDFSGAASLLRPMVGNEVDPESPLGWLMATVFGRTGETALVARMDQHALAARGRFNGVSLAHVREARRLAKDDPAKARELAARVVAAWSIADEPPPALAEMRALVAGQTPRPAGR